jgi:hypothetical protein
MYTIRSSGSIAQMIAEVKGIPARVIPYAASVALTRCAQRAQKVDLPAEMRRVFNNPTPYAINSLFVQAATKDKLSARVMVKNTAGRGVVPENFLFPEVAGGGRKNKGFETWLRYSGFLGAGEFAIPARDAKLDAYGNVSGPATKSLMAALGGSGGKTTFKINAKGKKVIDKRGTFGGGVFVRSVGKSRGIFQRDGSKLKKLFTFTSKAPVYRQRLDFTTIVQKTAEDNFKNEFNTAAAAILGRLA